MNAWRLRAAHRPDAGFTIIELLVVIAIIDVLVALLLPAVQEEREIENQGRTLQHLAHLLPCAHDYQRTNGTYPSTPVPVDVPCDLTATIAGDQSDGYRFTVLQATTDRYLLEAAPVEPGVTGAQTFRIDETGNLTTTPTAGSDEGRRHMFDEVLMRAAELAADFLARDPEALQQARAFTSAPGTVADIVTLLDRNADGALTPQEVLVTFERGDENTPAVLGSIYQSMHLGMAGEQVAAWPALRELTSRDDSLFSFEMLSRLSLLYEGSTPHGAGVGASLVAKLRQASSAERRGSPRVRDALLHAYINEVSAQGGVTLTTAQIATLTTFARTLR